jgi:threonine aldolase
LPAVTCAAEQVETNIVNFELPGRDATGFAAAAAAHGVKLSAISTHRLRAVTHLGVTREDMLDAVERLQHASASML